MSLINTNTFQFNNSSQRNKLSSKTIYTSTNATAGQLMSVPHGTNKVIVKMWGAGGGGNTNFNNKGGGGGYTNYTFVPRAGLSYYVSCGRASSTFSAATGGSIMNGGAGFSGNSASGGDASALFSLSGSTYTLLAVAGGGGGGGTSGAGGIGGGGGGGSSGQSGVGSPGPTGGSGGVGGIGTQGTGGAVSSLTQSSLTAFGGAGSAGNASISSGAGGGYGGGGSTNGAGSSGGGGFVNSSFTGYLSGSTTAGALETPANTGDVDYSGNAGLGGNQGVTGNSGRIVILYYRNFALSYVSDFTDSTTAAADTVPYFSFNFMPTPTLRMTNASITTTVASTLAIQGAPIAGPSSTITTPYALHVLGGSSLFEGGMQITPTTNQLILGTTNTTTLSATAPAASRTYTIPDAGGAANFILSTFGSTQSIAGGLTSSGTLTASNGFTQTTGALNLTSTSGAISLTGTTFSTNTQLQITPTTNQLVLGTTNTATISATAPDISRIYTIPDAGANSEIILSNAGIVSQQATLAPVSPNSSTFVGIASSICDNYCAISSHTTGTGGQVIIFVRDGNTWTLQQTIAASDAASGAEFGHSISISSTGIYVIVGAHNADIGGTDRGRAYVFIRSGTTWTQQQILTAGDPVTNAKFGESVSISSDGNYAIVGAQGHSSSGIARGQAYVFIRSGTTWTQQQMLAASDKSDNALFGSSVSISSDGTYAIVGARDADSGGIDRGQAYIFIRSGASWTEQAILIASDPNTDAEFGYSVSIDSTGTYAVVGAFNANSSGTNRGQAYIFIRSGVSWTEQAILIASDAANSANFGYSVAINGARVVVGAPHANGAGSDRGQAYIFNRSGTSWTQQKKLIPSDAQDSAFFGGSASMCESYACVGSQNYDITPFTNSGKVYVFSGKQTLGSGVLSSGMLETSMCRISSPITVQNSSIPAISHTINANTGLYFPLDNTIGLSANGVVSTIVDETGVQSLKLRSNSATGVQNATTPAITHTSDPDTGIYFPLDNTLGFCTAGASRVIIDASGNLLLGTSSVLGGATSSTVYSNTASNDTFVWRNTAASAGRYWRIGMVSAGECFVYNANSNGVYMTYGGTSWLANSDERMKKNINSLELGLEQIKALRPVRFDYKNDESEESARVGFIAQEVLSTLPHAVHAPEDSEKMMGVSVAEMIPVLVKAIQELEVRLAAVENKI
jgi:hypothetical protein